jgi:hypothetical protein
MFLFFCHFGYKVEKRLDCKELKPKPYYSLSLKLLYSRDLSLSPCVLCDPQKLES